MRRRVISNLGAVLLGLAVVVAGLALAPAHRSLQRAEASAGILTDATPIPVGAKVSPLAPSALLQVTVTLRPADRGGLTALVASFAHPGPGHPRYLTESEFVDRFSPRPSTMNAVESYLHSNGAVSMTATADRLGLIAVLPARGVESAFHLQLMQYGLDGSGPRFSAVGTPLLPPPLAGEVVSISGLSSSGRAQVSSLTHVTPAPHHFGRPSVPAFSTDNSTGESVFVGSDFTQAYRVSSLFPPSGTTANASFPTTEAVATILLSGFNDTTQSDLPGYDPVAVAAYFNDTFPSTWPHPMIIGVPVTINNVTPPAPAGSGAINDSSFDETENALDLEMAGSLAPGASIYNFYFAASLYLSRAVNPTSLNVADDFATTLGDALSHNYSPSRLVAVTNSFGLPDVNDSLWDVELLHAAATGVTVVAASGDQADAPPGQSGRIQGQWPGWPASAAFDSSATVAVGGTSVTLTGSPSGFYNGSTLNATFDSTVTGVATSTAWYDTLGGNLSGTEGGVSAVFSEPSWQFNSAAQPAIVNVSVQEGVASLGRSEPDLAFAANATVAYTAHDSTGVYYDVLEGTSIASPLFAGFLASCSAVSGHLYGGLDPELYRIGSYMAANPGSNDPFIDVTNGSNYVFSAAPGWDGVTGWGQLTAPLFLAADANASIRNYVYHGPTPGLPPYVPPKPTPVPYTALLILGVAAAAAVAFVIWSGRPRRGTNPPPPYAAPPSTITPPPYAPLSGGVPSRGGGPVPPGAYGYASAPATFSCPYCGKMRPAEPVRCPTCGAY